MGQALCLRVDTSREKQKSDLTNLLTRVFAKKIVGYDANALYLSTMAFEMPCGKERVHFPDDQNLGAANWLTESVKKGTWFGFAELDIEIPKALWPMFEQMCPFFINKPVPQEAVAQEMLDYLKRTGRIRGHCGGPFCTKNVNYASLLRWCVEHGAVVTAVYRTIDYEPRVVFEWFVQEVTKAKRTGDVEKSKALLAEIFKLLGNSAYGKLIENLERQTNVIYTKDEKVADRGLRSAFFSDLDEIGEAYELESRKPQITIRRPFQVEIAVYQLAKLRILEFYYEAGAERLL